MAEQGDYKRLEARVGIEPTHKGFADLSLTTWVPRPCESEQRFETEPVHLRSTSQLETKEIWSGRRDLNPRLRPWQGRTLPLSYSCSALPLKNGGGVRAIGRSLRKLQLLQWHGFGSIRASVPGVRLVSLAQPAQREYDRRKQYCGKPNPYKFALNNGESSCGEKTRDSDW